MPTYRLHHSDVEVARLLFHAAGQEFEDIVYTKETWPEFRPRTPFGQLPCLEIDGKLYSQSWAIFRYLAMEFGFYGKCHLDALRIEIVIGLIGDFSPLMVKAFFLEKDNNKKKELTEQVLNEHAPKFLTNIEKVLKENGSNGYFVNDSLTLADFTVFDLVEKLIERKPDILEHFPVVGKNRQTVMSHPLTSNYLKSRKYKSTADAYHI